MVNDNKLNIQKIKLDKPQKDKFLLYVPSEWLRKIKELAYANDMTVSNTFYLLTETGLQKLMYEQKKK